MPPSSVLGPGLLWSMGFLALLFFFFGHVVWLVGSSFPNQRANSAPQQRKHRVLTNREFSGFAFFFFYFFLFVVNFVIH